MGFGVKNLKQHGDEKYFDYAFYFYLFIYLLSYLSKLLFPQIYSWITETWLFDQRHLRRPNIARYNLGQKKRRRFEVRFQVEDQVDRKSVSRFTIHSGKANKATFKHLKCSLNLSKPLLSADKSKGQTETLVFQDL